MFKKVDLKKLIYSLKHLLNKKPRKISRIKNKDKDSIMRITKEPIRICNHKFNDNTIMLGCGGSGKVRRYVVPSIPKTVEDKENQISTILK